MLEGKTRFSCINKNKEESLPIQEDKLFKIKYNYPLSVHKIFITKDEHNNYPG